MNVTLGKLEKVNLRKVWESEAGDLKLSGQEKYRLRQGNYRIIYSIQDTQLTVWGVKVGHRREVYRM